MYIYITVVNNAVGLNNYPYFFGYVATHTVCTGLQAYFAAGEGEIAKIE